MSEHENGEDRNVMIYMLAGIGLGALIGAAAGLLFAPKAGNEMRDDVGRQVADLRKKVGDWVTERKSKASRELSEVAEELAAG